jgi:hypothetical protein
MNSIHTIESLAAEYVSEFRSAPVTAGWLETASEGEGDAEERESYECRLERAILTLQATNAAEHYAQTVCDESRNEDDAKIFVSAVPEAAFESATLIGYDNACRDIYTAKFTKLAIADLRSRAASLKDDGITLVDDSRL